MSTTPITRRQRTTAHYAERCAAAGKSIARVSCVPADCEECAMEMQEKNGMSVFWMGMLLGVAAGAAVGLLYAPTRGREARDYLSYRARQGRDLALATAEKGREAVSQSREAVTQAKSV